MAGKKTRVIGEAELLRAIESVRQEGEDCTSCYLGGGSHCYKDNRVMPPTACGWHITQRGYESLPKTYQKALDALVA